MYEDEISFGKMLGYFLAVVFILFAVVLVIDLLSVEINPFFRHKQYENIRNSQSYIVTHTQAMRSLYEDYWKLESEILALEQQAGTEQRIEAKRQLQNVYVRNLLDEADLLREEDVPEDIQDFISNCRQGDCR